MHNFFLKKLDANFKITDKMTYDFIRHKMFNLDSTEEVNIKNL